VLGPPAPRTQGAPNQSPSCREGWEAQASSRGWAVLPCTGTSAGQQNASTCTRPKGTMACQRAHPQGPGGQKDGSSPPWRKVRGQGAMHRDPRRRCRPQGPVDKDALSRRLQSNFNEVCRKLSPVRRTELGGTAHHESKPPATQAADEKGGNALMRLQRQAKGHSKMRLEPK
jgi:hypothetical protein